MSSPRISSADSLVPQAPLSAPCATCPTSTPPSPNVSPQQPPLPTHPTTPAPLPLELVSQDSTWTPMPALPWTPPTSLTAWGDLTQPLLVMFALLARLDSHTQPLLEQPQPHTHALPTPLQTAPLPTAQVVFPQRSAPLVPLDTMSCYLIALVCHRPWPTVVTPLVPLLVTLVPRGTISPVELVSSVLLLSLERSLVYY